MQHVTVRRPTFYPYRESPVPFGQEVSWIPEKLLTLQRREFLVPVGKGMTSRAKSQQRLSYTGSFISRTASHMTHVLYYIHRICQQVFRQTYNAKINSPHSSNWPHAVYICPYVKQLFIANISTRSLKRRRSWYYNTDQNQIRPTATSKFTTNPLSFSSELRMSQNEVGQSHTNSERIQMPLPKLASGPRIQNRASAQQSGC